MTWEPELEELRQRQALAREMGGPDEIARQRAAGRLTVRERIDTLLDTGSFHYRYAWPTADWGSLPIEGGIEAAYKAALDAADDRTALAAEITQRLNRMRSPFRSADKFQIEEIIDPRDTPKLLCEFADIAAPLRTTQPLEFAYRP